MVVGAKGRRSCSTVRAIRIRTRPLSGPLKNACGPVSPVLLRAAGQISRSFWASTCRGRRGSRSKTFALEAIARAAGLVDLWWAAKQVNSSPIAYADAGPEGYEVGVAGTGAKPTPSPEALRRQALTLCTLPQMEREACPVVVMSGRADLRVACR